MDGGVAYRAGDGERHALGPASSATIKATTEATAGRFCISENDVNAPAGFEHSMRELAAAASAGAMTTQRMGEIASRYDVRVVD